MPLLICVLVSYAISNSLSVSFFDLLLDMKNLPYIPALRSKEAYSMDAGDIMNRNFIYLTRDSTLSDIAILLQYVGTQPKSIPVVETPEQKWVKDKYLDCCYSKCRLRAWRSTSCTSTTEFNLDSILRQSEPWRTISRQFLTSAKLT